MTIQSKQFQLVSLCPAAHISNVVINSSTMRNVYTGNLYCNNFSIILRGFGNERDKFEENFQKWKNQGFVNYYGLQRFQIGNLSLGEFLIKKSILDKRKREMSGVNERSDQNFEKQYLTTPINPSQTMAHVMTPTKSKTPLMSL